MSDLIPNVGAGGLLEQILLADDRAVRVGAIQELNYDRAVVITHDKWKEEVGGIPRFAFLLATAREIGSGGGDDDEVLLLRVEGTAPLALERDLGTIREEALRDALSREQNPSPSAILDVNLNLSTTNSESFTGLDCQIIGTFYEIVRDGKTVLEFGHDVDNFYATATYRVFKPVNDGLSAIASYVKPTHELMQMMRIGAVRYSSTRRRTMLAKQADVPVKVNVYDFIGNKTGLFGMTRMGKSNTVKTIAARVFEVSEQQRAAGMPAIGQLILDPHGEYANANTQDSAELAAIGTEYVGVYRLGADGSQANVRPLGFNFFDPNQIEAVKGLISSALADAGSDYVRAFIEADFVGLTALGRRQQDAERAARASRGRLILYGALAKADFPVPTTQVDTEGREFPWRAWVPMRRALADELERRLDTGHVFRPQRGSMVGIERDSLIKVIDWLIERTEAQDLSGDSAEGLRSLVSGDAWRSALPIYTQVSQGRTVSGYTRLKPLRSFHTPSSKFDYREEIYEELARGKIVIVDLHLGPDAIVRQLSENLAGFLMGRQTDALSTGAEPPHIQVAFEEAHNLFSSEKYEDELDVWVRMAKQASKLKIGILYATQEVTGVAHQVLASTRNWVVAHLNNTQEVDALSKFYDFKAFSKAIISDEDAGYVRLKTMSSPYIVPVHIDLYRIEIVNQARAAANSPLHSLSGQ